MKTFKIERPTCGCGNTSDPDGYCDGSHSAKQELDYDIILIKKLRTFVLSFFIKKRKPSVKN